MSITLESLFYCFSLQTSVKVVGIFYLLTAIGGLVLAIQTKTFSSEKPLDDVAESPLLDNITISEKVSELVNSTLLITSSVITISLAIFVLIAAWKNRKHRFLLPWLIWNPLPMIFGIAFTIYYAVNCWTEKEFATLGFLSASAIAGYNTITPMPDDANIPENIAT
ncbi:uncharacterized protein LOC124313373 isoform X2 [Daphnia pulicaria]|uniref:uncharacterized protein LOC124313373 isoform X2 n=1 Tax=Daphnia pulicaria TaxID=35523 RepID=UPI001EEBB6CC|nr:uncharacterized protein LOC124313373 isoform X2 [Daphnia pulicaria]